MDVVAGASGNTGGAVARELLARGAPVRVLVRDADKGAAWRRAGAEVAMGDLTDAASLVRAFAGARGVYVLNPPAYPLPDLFAQARAIAEAVASAAREARLERLVVLSSVGAHRAEGTGIIATNRTFEKRLGGLGIPVVFLRSAYFLSNWAWVAGPAAAQGVLPSFLAPAERAIPMVAATDIGRVAAAALLSDEPGGVIELAGPRSYSPRDVAAAFARVLGRGVEVVEIPEAGWGDALGGSGFAPRTIAAWTEMFRGFNSGWIGFEGGEDEVRRGGVELAEVAAAIAAPLRQGPPPAS